MRCCFLWLSWQSLTTAGMEVPCQNSAHGMLPWLGKIYSSSTELWRWKGPREATQSKLLKQGQPERGVVSRWILSISKDGTSPPSALRHHLAAQVPSPLLVAHVQVSAHQDPQFFPAFPWSPSLPHPANTGAFPSPEAEHFISSLLNSIRFLPPHSQTVQVPPGTLPIPPSLVPTAEIVKRTFCPIIQIRKMLIRTGVRSSRIDPWDPESVIGCQLHFVPPITTQPLPQFSIHSLSAPPAQTPRVRAPNHQISFAMLEGMSCIFTFILHPKQLKN